MEDSKLFFKVKQEESEGVYSDKVYRFDKIMNFIVKYISNVFGIVPKNENTLGLSDQVQNLSKEIEQIKNTLITISNNLSDIKTVENKLNALEFTVGTINEKIGSIQIGEENGYKDCVTVFLNLNDDICKQLAIWQDRKLVDLVYQYVYTHNKKEKTAVDEYVNSKDEYTLNSVKNLIKDIDNFYHNYMGEIVNFLSKNGEKDFHKCIVNPCERIFDPQIHQEQNFMIYTDLTDVSKRPKNKKTFNYLSKLGYDFPRCGKSKALVFTENDKE